MTGKAVKMVVIITYGGLIFDLDFAEALRTYQPCVVLVGKGGKCGGREREGEGGEGREESGEERGKEGGEERVEERGSKREEGKEDGKRGREWGEKERGSG